MQALTQTDAKAIASVNTSRNLLGLCKYIGFRSCAANADNCYRSQPTNVNGS
jgi:hypothetical protein